MPRSVILFSVIFYFVSNVYSARILGLFPHPGKSHQIVFDPLMIKLAERGHELTVATFFPLENRPKNYKEINLQPLAELRLESFHVGAYEFPSWYTKIPVVGNIITQYKQHVGLAESAMTICDKLVKFQPFIEVLKGEYDVVITEFFNSRCVFGLMDEFGLKAPVIAISSCVLLPGHAAVMGADDNPSYVPLATSSFLSKMSFLQRLENTIGNILIKQVYREVQKKEQAIIERHFGRPIADLTVSANNISLLFVNTYHAVDGVYPLVPGIIEIGGIHISEPVYKKIPAFIEKYLNESEHGVVLLSFGSQLSTTSISVEKQDLFIDSLAKLKQRVIWKHATSADKGTLVARNILRVRWLPQYELIRHPNVKAVICHGGKLGTTEVIAAGKPMVVMPVFADQKLNAEAIKAAGAGEIIDLPNLTEQDLDKALQNVLSERMQEKARLVSKIWHDRETSPLHTAVYWTERVIKWGNQSTLHSEARNLPFYQLALLDVVVFLTLLILLILGLAVSIGRRISRFIRSLSKPDKEKIY